MNIGTINETLSLLPPELSVNTSTARAEATSISQQGMTSQSASSVPKEEELRHMVAEMQRHIESMRVNLKFSTYGEHGERIAIAVMNGETGEVVREIPPKEIQELYERMAELVGMIFNRNA